ALRSQRELSFARDDADRLRRTRTHDRRRRWGADRAALGRAPRAREGRAMIAILISILAASVPTAEGVAIIPVVRGGTHNSIADVREAASAAVGRCLGVQALSDPELFSTDADAIPARATECANDVACIGRALHEVNARYAMFIALNLTAERPVL